MRPLRSLLLLLTILCILTGLAFLLPERKLAPLPEEFFSPFNTYKQGNRSAESLLFKPVSAATQSQSPDTVVVSDTYFF
jgi:hypothetical protein